MHNAVPEILFVRVKRDRRKVVESVLCAFNELGYFHPLPSSLQSKKINDPIEFACAQIDEIEKKLDEQFCKLKPIYRFTIQYEEFCKNPYDFIYKLAYEYLNFSEGTVLKSSALDKLKASGGHKVSETERKKINSIINKNMMGKKN